MNASETVGSSPIKRLCSSLLRRARLAIALLWLAFE
jgi:hypothetical protein